MAGLSACASQGFSPGPRLWLPAWECEKAASIGADDIQSDYHPTRAKTAAALSVCLMWYAYEVGQKYSSI
jgi:hypothetical protein